MRASHAAVLIAFALLGVAAGLGAYTFVYARGWSYLTDDPRACANCHVMNEQYDGWLKASHRSVATCNDCHTPHDLLGKYWVKAQNGFWHSFYFTTQTFHEPIRITKGGRRVAEKNCRHCHAAIVDAMVGAHDDPHGDELSCIRCHGSVGHRELSATSLALDER
jgi:cytochrome c nitrite reductase small subunit